MEKLIIQIDSLDVLKHSEAIYVFQTWCSIIGVPWHFVSKGYDGEVHIYYGRDENKKANLIIREVKNDLEINPNEIEVFDSDGINYLNFSQVKHDDKILEKIQKDILLKNDIVASSFYMLSGKNEKFIERDKYDRHKIEQSFLYKNDLLHLPLVDEYAQLIKHLFKDKFDFIPKWPNNKRVAIALSHDTDYPQMIKSIEAARITFYKKKLDLKRIYKIYTNQETFWKFPDWMQLEKKYNTVSAFYMCSFKGSLFRYVFIAPDTFYNIKNIRYKKVAKELVDEGFEIGLHSSFNAYKSESGFKDELNKLEHFLEVPVKGNRHHYWHLDQNTPYKTIDIHERIGLLYDSSIGYERHSGFRYGICTPFQVFNPSKERKQEILQLPPTLMDDHLFGHAHLSKFISFKDHIDDILEQVYKYEGICIVDYHVRVLNNTFFPEWGDSYEYLLKRINEKGDFYCKTPVEIAEHWKERLRIIESNSEDESSSTDK